MARLVVRTLDVTKPLVARRRFVASGRRFNPGEPFPWKDLGVSTRQVGLLFNTGNVVHPTVMPAPVAASTAEALRAVAQNPDADRADRVAAAKEILARGAGAITPEPTIEMEMQDADTHHVAATSAATDEQPAAPVEGGGLDGLNLKELRQIAADEGAPTRVSRDEQREAIRAHRLATADAVKPAEGSLDA